MEGQGVAASSASAAGRHGQSGVGAVAAAELSDSDENRVTSDIADGGEGRGVNGDDSHVTVAPGYPEASAQDAEMASPLEPLPSRRQASPGQDASREPQPSEASHAPESDKPDIIVVPDHNDEASPHPLNTINTKNLYVI